MNERGESVEDYDAPLFVAWQLTNHCSGSCLACCEESGPEHVWKDELSRDQAMAVVDEIVAAEVPFVAFGGGEPLGVAHCWEVFEALTDAGVALKLETNGMHIDDATADRLAELSVDCIQISVDGAAAATHDHLRPGSSHAAAIRAIERLVARDQATQSVFVPNRINLGEMIGAYDRAAALGCTAFVTGPLMRIGRAATAWGSLACSDSDWQGSVSTLQAHAAACVHAMRLAIYPWDILHELERRLASPQAMLLIVPNGMVKLLNALPFAVADLRRDGLLEAWQRYVDAWHAPEVRAFIAGCHAQPALLRHANALWPLQGA